MSYDISLCDPVTMQAIEIDEPHFMKGGTYQVGGSTELWLNITHNYANYYYEANSGGIRAIHGMTGAESVSILEYMIKAITEKYKDSNGQWINGKRTRNIFFDRNGNKIDLDEYIKSNDATSEKQEYTVNEGDVSNYWEETAANAIKPLYQLIAFAKMRPDGVWKGD